jgi:hypothetical protein
MIKSKELIEDHSHKDNESKTLITKMEKQIKDMEESVKLLQEKNEE